MTTLYYGGPILTMSDPLYVPALLTGDGKILAVGEKDELRSLAPDAALVDLDGRALLPGFIDPHSHLTAYSLAQNACSVSGAADAGEIARRIRAYLEEKRPEPGSFLTVRGYDNTALPGGRHPSLDEIDAFAPGYPLCIRHKTEHLGIFNSAAMERLGITPETPDPPGGRIVREDGRLTGVFEEGAFSRYAALLPAATAEDVKNALLLGQQKYFSYGITTAQDGMLSRRELTAYSLLAGEKKLLLDVFGNVSARGRDVLLPLYRPEDTGGKLRLLSQKSVLDGSPQLRTAWMTKPYLGGDCYRAGVSDEWLTEAMRGATAAGLQVLCHCNGDATIDQFLRCAETVERETLRFRELRPVIIHAQFMRGDQLARAAALGVIPSFFAAHVYHWGDVHLANLGWERAAHCSPAASALALGLPFTFHQDAPVIEPDMIETLWCACCRLTKSGVRFEEAISPLDALRAVTVNAAYSYFEEERKGILAPGRDADLVLLSADPLAVPPEELRSLRVEATVKAGETVYSR